MKEQYKPSQKEIDKAESMMTNPQKEITANLKNHFKEIGSLGKRGMVILTIPPIAPIFKSNSNFYNYRGLTNQKEMSEKEVENTKELNKHLLEKAKWQYQNQSYNLEGNINGHRFFIILGPDKENQNSSDRLLANECEVKVGWVDGGPITTERAQEIVDKYLPIAFDVSRATELGQKHKREKDVDEAIREIL